MASWFYSKKANRIPLIYFFLKKSTVLSKASSLLYFGVNPKSRCAFSEVKVKSVQVYITANRLSLGL